MIINAMEHLHVEADCLKKLVSFLTTIHLQFRFSNTVTMVTNDGKRCDIGLNKETYLVLPH